MALTPGWETPYGTRYLASFTKKENQSLRYMNEYFENNIAMEKFAQSFDNKLEHKLDISEVSTKRIAFSIEYHSPDFKEIDGVIENFIITEEGIEYNAALINPKVKKISFMIPAFMTNGKDISKINISSNTVDVLALNSAYTIRTNGNIVETPYVLGNRNGRYKKYMAIRESKEINLCFKIDKV